VTNWLGAYAPVGTPKDIVAKLNAAFKAAMADPMVRQRLADHIIRDGGRSAEPLARWQQNGLSGRSQWDMGTVAKVAGRRT
jgi:tripartite-type tricarboxylate transporter receptor subunit TctC